MTRDEMIHLLVLDRLEYRDDQARYLHLQTVLENGFCGFRKLSDKELASEIRARGLSLGVFADTIAEHDDGADNFADDHVFDSSLFVGHAFDMKPAGDFSQ